LPIKGLYVMNGTTSILFELRRSTKLKLPDSIVAATSFVLDAILLTDDEHFLSLPLPGLKTQNIF